MLTQKQFAVWWGRFRLAFPAVGHYADQQGQHRDKLLEVWREVLGGFTPDTLEGVTKGIISGEFEPVPNTQLGQFAHEIRQRARQVVERVRRSQPQEWERDESPKWSAAAAIAGDAHMRHMLRCAKAALRLMPHLDTSIRRYHRPGSINPARDSYDAAIVMADDHSPAEEVVCLETFARDGLSWEQILEVAHSEDSSYGDALRDA